MSSLLPLTTILYYYMFIYDILFYISVRLLEVFSPYPTLPPYQAFSLESKSVNNKCPRNKDCDIDQVNKDKCQYCWLQKCAAVGMGGESPNGAGMVLVVLPE